jgi:heat shock protein HslJ
MTIKNFFAGRAIGFIIILILAGLGAFWYDRTHPSDANNAEPSHPVAENPEGEADPGRMTLGMTVWKWDEGKEFTLTFGDDGRFTATTDCNSMGGTYAAAASKGVLGTGTIAFSNIFSTEMYCANSREGEFATILGQAEGYHFTGRGQLVLDLTNGKTAAFR